MRVAYQGRPGAFSELAAHDRFSVEATTVACDTFDAAVRAVADDRADAAVIPVRNSTTSAVAGAADALALADALGLRRDGETTLAVRHALLARPGVALADVRRVASHPQALAQCAGWLTRHLPHAVVAPGPTDAPDTAGAAAEIAREGWTDAAAVAHASAATRYDLAVLADAIADRADNRTTFAVVLRP